jgi:hypothetical protein
MSQIRGIVPPNINYFNNSNSATNIPKYYGDRQSDSYINNPRQLDKMDLDVAVEYVQTSNPNGVNPNKIENFLNYNDGPGMHDLRPNRVNPSNLFH